MRRFILGACSAGAALAFALAAPACGSDNDADGKDAGNSSGFGGDGNTECIGLCQKQVTCPGGGSTTISGVVKDPAGKVPIFNAIVYVPNAPVEPLKEGASCDRCNAAVSGNPLVITQTDVDGKFKLENMPVGENIPLVVQIGKWRRQVTVGSVGQCVDTVVDAETVRLPRKRSEGDIPRIAVATGAADPLQCLLYKIGLDKSEFGIRGSDARVHLYQGAGYNNGPGNDIVAQDQLDDGTTFPKAESLWGTVDALKPYDVVLLSCEGDDAPNDTVAHKPATAKKAVYDYASTGGRVFASHYHHSFFSTATDPAAPAEVSAIANWSQRNPEPIPPAVGTGPVATTAVNADFVGTFPKAVAMKQWLQNQGALVSGQLPIVDAHHNVNSVNAGALNWIELTNPNAGNTKAVQYMTFNTPIGAGEDAVCGRVVFSGLHVASGLQDGKIDNPTSAAKFPTEACLTTDLSAQQKALEYMLFDLSSCVQEDSKPIVVR
jgi:hypothetical protein